MSIHSIPARSLEQRAAALARANQVRAERARLKRALRETPHEEAAWLAAGVVQEPPGWADSMRVWDLLLGLPKFGQVKVGRTLLKLGISQGKRVGGLSPRQRKLLVDELTSKAVRR